MVRKCAHLDMSRDKEALWPLHTWRDILRHGRNETVTFVQVGDVL